MTRGLKGQAVFEFIVASILFFGIIFYMISFLNSSVSSYSSSSQMNDLESRATSISEYLIHIGLAEEWPTLSYDSIHDFNDTCNSDYFGTRDLLDLVDSRNFMKIQLNESGIPLLDCEQGSGVPDVPRAELERFALSENNSVMNMRVVVWRR